MSESAPADGFDPFFIVGCDRSGTTLLAALLDRHTRIAVPPETHFFRHVYDRDRDEPGLTHAAALAKFHAAERPRDMRLDPERLAERFGRLAPTYPNLFRAAMQEYAAERGKPRAGEKTPGHLKHVPQLLRLYPQAKFVCLTRDGRDVALSLRRVPWIHDDLRRHGLRWNAACARVREYAAAYPDRVATLFFEDLLRAPGREMTRLCGFLGLAFEPGQLDPSVKTGVVPAWEKDWKEKAGETIDPGRIGAWRREASDDEKWMMNAVMGGWLREMGYPDTSLAGCPLPRRAYHRASAWAYRLLAKRYLSEAPASAGSA